eukprot:gnl/Chilomastix_cuspidata/497.p3 GENE.gnl/Chilomastix_cuspidata/497~~gnl/Chilomastix_cuspidata/497.p3  ORF type:complete len:245 (-),score=136.31 gnl/Chilomastix_cuspidata/497:86-820(-)
MSVKLNFTHNLLKERFMEIRFCAEDRVATLKDDIYLKTLTSPEHQQLQVLDEKGELVGKLTNESLTLREAGLRDYMTIHIIDTNPYSMARGGALSDVSLVKKFELTDEEYDARAGTVREYKRRLYETDEEYRAFVERKARLKVEMDDRFREEAARVHVGERCEVSLGGRRGEVAFVGRVHGLHAGFWVGVRLDEPSGAHDGELKGVRYFDAPPRCGLFVRPFYVETGDFPELDIFSESDSVDEL